jgi:hypothetical protein
MRLGAAFEAGRSAFLRIPEHTSTRTQRARSSDQRTVPRPPALSPLHRLLIDRTNVGFAALQMNRDLEFGPAVYGLGAGIFCLGYALFEVPSNLILARVGARRWIARIAVSWGVLAAATMFVRTPASFYAMRLLLGCSRRCRRLRASFHGDRRSPSDHPGGPR